jgi:curved DNA-binding protein CbpA
MKLYEILGVKEDATVGQIKSAYRNLAKQKHPDKGGDDEEFAELNYAYRVLMDPGSRLLYDTSGKTDIPALEQEIQNVLLQGFQQSLANGSDDILKFVRNFVRDGECGLRDTKQKLIKEMDVLRKQRDRVETTSEINLFHMIVDKGIKDREGSIQEIERKLLIAKSCYEVLDTYKIKESNLPQFWQPGRTYEHSFYNIDLNRIRREFQKNMMESQLNVSEESDE